MENAVFIQIAVFIIGLLIGMQIKKNAYQKKLLDLEAKYKAQNKSG